MTALPFVLRPPRADDVPLYTAHLGDPEVTIWLEDYCQRPVSMAQAEAFLLRDTWCCWSIECESAFAGATGLDLQDLAHGTARFFIVIGNRQLWRRGLGTAVTERVLENGFSNLGLRKINSDYLEPNMPSHVIHERAGFVVEGRLRQDAWRKGRWIDRTILSILKDEFDSRKSH
jgi:RimJ/RimL family protein N-acetyltransferase